jgi:hypothetical protein
MLNRYWNNYFKPALIYFAIVFCAGFALGPIRILWLIPRTSVRTAELLEMPIMIMATLLSARWVARRYRIPLASSLRLGIGLIALLLLVTAEVALGVARRLSLSQIVIDRDPVSGSIYVIALLLFALMPALIVFRKNGFSGSGLIESFISYADVAESHEIVVRAPADLVFDVARNLDLLSLPIVSAIFRLREKLFRSKSEPRSHRQGLVAETMALGWGVLVERPHRELVVGAVTQPWVGDVKFRPIPPEQFASFAEPDLVKIAWTLEVDPVERGLTRFRTQTRVLATDENARRKFRRYWRLTGAGIILIRWLANRAIRRESEGRVRSSATLTNDRPALGKSR